MNSKEVAFKLEVLYNKLATYSKVKYEIEELEREIAHVKYNCPHDDAYILEEGHEFDGYDRNEYFADIKCPDCGKQWAVYDKFKAKKYQIIDGVTKLKVYRG